MKSNDKITFYEGLFLIVWFWIILSFLVLSILIIYSAVTNQSYFIKYILLGYFALVVMMVLLHKLFSALFFRKITVSINGIGIKKRKKNQFYFWNDIKSIDYRTDPIEAGEFIMDILLSIFKIRECYLNIMLDSENDIKPILVSKRQKRFINKIRQNIVSENIL